MHAYTLRCMCVRMYSEISGKFIARGLTTKPIMANTITFAEYFLIERICPDLTSRD